MSQFYPLKVSSIERTTRDAVVVAFEVPAELEEKFIFRPGQYLNVRTQVDGEELRRSYSICAAPHDNLLRVAVKRVADGAFSSWANAHLEVGSTLEVMPPDGNFTVDFDAAHQRGYAAFAVGSGITPILSLVKTALDTEPNSTFTLFYANRASSSIMFREEIEDLKNRYMNRFSVVYIMSRELQDIDLFNGRLDAEKVDQLLSVWLPPEKIDYAFVCGPHDMTEQVVATLTAKGLTKEQIKYELFGAPKGPRTTASGAAPRQAPGAEDCQLTIIQDGFTRDITIKKNHLSLVDAAMEQGIELPFSCKGGVCSTCRCKVVEGEVDMDANFALEDYEVNMGFVLSCQSFPVTDKVVIDFDQET